MFDNQDGWPVEYRRAGVVGPKSNYFNGREAGQNGRESAAAAQRAVDGDHATLCFDDAFGQCQAQASALMQLGCAGIQLLELDKQTIQVLGTYADAGVFDLMA